MNKNCIRERDKYYYTKEHGIIPAGFTMHHLWYDEEYNPDSFVIITKEEHEEIHGRKVPCSNGFNRVEYHEKYGKEYRENNREELNEKHREYHKEHLEQEHATSKAYYESHKEEIINKQKEYQKANREKHNEYMREYRKRMKYREKLIKMGVI